MSRVAGNSTRPLQISRPSSRPTTPSNSSSRSGPGPSRPQRSEKRTHRGQPSIDSLETASTADRYGSPQETTPVAMSSVMSAFRDAGVRKRTLTTDGDMEYHRDRQYEIEMENKRQQRIRDKVSGRRMNGKPRAGDIDAILDQIKDEWEFVVDPDFNHVDLALQLLDESSEGKSMSSFQSTKKMLSNALKGSVDKHYQAFNASLGHHASLLTHLAATQAQITDARTSLTEAKDALGNKRADLVQLWSRGQTLEEMLRILDQIEHLKTVPDILETLMSEKRLLQASILLVRSLKMINKPDMLEIGAVSDLRNYLDGQETALREILIDELHSHLYLKSFWCESRWAAYTPNQQTMAEVEYDKEIESTRPVSSDIPTSPTSPSYRSSRLNKFLGDLSLRPNDPPHDLNEKVSTAPSLSSTLSSASLPNFPSNPTATASQNANPEQDSFAYMETLLESMAVLGRMGQALDNIVQRVPNEIYAMVETTLDEVEERAEYGRRGSAFTVSGTTTSGAAYVFTSGESGPGLGLGLPTGGLLSPSTLRLAALESASQEADRETLKDFFWTLYSKIDAVAQGLRVIYEVTIRIASRRDFKDVSGTKAGALFPLADVWMPIQAEVRTLLYDYLTDEEQSSVSGRNPISSINEVLRESKFTRDKSKPVFRFADTDMKLTTKLLKQHEDELTRVIKETMPGLVQASYENQVQTVLSTVGADDRLLGSGQHHRVLIRPDAFHVSVLFRPTLSFMDNVISALPSGTVSTQSGSEVLDDFVLQVYLPQLEEKVSNLFHQAVTGTDAFQPDPASTRISNEPLVKASTQLMALVNSLAAMLRTTPFHRENYSRLILGVIIQFYQRCSDRFQDLVSTQPGDHEPPRPSLAAQWAQRSELQPCLAELLTTPATDATKLLHLSRQETHLELDFLEQGTVSQADLVLSIRNLSAMGSLFRSISWFVTHLSALNSVQDTPLSPQTIEPASAMFAQAPFAPTAPSASSVEPLKLALSREMAMRFQALLKTYDQLAELILISIRIDVRCRTIHYLDTAMRYGNYTIDREPNEPDPHVIDLNTDLSRCDQLISGTLPKKEQQFIFAGLGHLMEHLLVANARHLRLVNAFGIKKILRNMLALQQSIRTITNGVQNTEFTRAKEYYSLFFITPTEMLDSIRVKRSFNFEEYETMLALQCGVNRAAGEVGVADATDRNFGMYVIDLHELFTLHESSP